MLLVNTDYITGEEIEMIGLVIGSMVQTVHLGKDFGAAFKTLVGGEITSYTEMMEESRSVATQRMIAEAERLGADAIVNVRYTTSSVMQSAAECTAYGTAVRFVNR